VAGLIAGLLAQGMPPLTQPAPGLAAWRGGPPFSARPDRRRLAERAARHFGGTGRNSRIQP
jgi:hypothetical protein